MGCAGRGKRRRPKRGSGEEQFQFWERWVAETKRPSFFCGKIWVETQDKATALSAEPQRGEAEVKVIASKQGVFYPRGWGDTAGWL